MIRIDRRPLGRTGLLVSSLGMGCARLGTIWQGRSDGDARQALSLALSAGINFFDPSDVYAIAIFLLFMPLGFLAGIRWPSFDRWSAVFALGIGLSLGIETSSFAWAGTTEA